MTGAASPRIEAFEAKIAVSARHRLAGYPRRAFAALERAHVLGQRDFSAHLRVHGWMLRVGWETGDSREVVGQLMRLALVPLGRLLPIGNTGGASVSAFAPMGIPPELKRLLQGRDR
ncbi:DUF3703 domain-containing protein [Accumulibacter sp.]|jgi:hypothetical protein|uniref:DUF3703 domain-containing protein n=1 Tax=Accumulibacter sp. TaxID=2053492 RepID=UPI002623AC75|nr:DUF3703 domain-containing protein [Accumulibacter sp.]